MNFVYLLIYIFNFKWLRKWSNRGGEIVKNLCNWLVCYFWSNCNVFLFVVNMFNIVFKNIGIVYDVI